jgi:hypothetical protein|tara:strand:- start:1276 stop:1695 length:420 start_codon:yes stop_codon:yes gene_type:complete
MSAIREEIRAILREELAALAEPMPQITTETVQISCSADLMRFAQDILTRAACPIFVANIATGRIRFTLPEIQPAMLPNAIVSSPEKQGGALLNKNLVTERDILELTSTSKTIRLQKHARITPLASDEAHRRGIRIERIK